MGGVRGTVSESTLTSLASLPVQQDRTYFQGIYSELPVMMAKLLQSGGFRERELIPTTPSATSSSMAETSSSTTSSTSSMSSTDSATPTPTDPVTPTPDSGAEALRITSYLSALLFLVLLLV